MILSKLYIGRYVVYLFDVHILTIYFCRGKEGGVLSLSHYLLDSILSLQVIQRKWLTYMYSFHLNRHCHQSGYVHTIYAAAR